MQKKTLDKLERKNRKTWAGFYTRKTPTKQEKLEKIKRKEKQQYKNNYNNN